MIHLESGDNTNTYLDSVVALVTDQGTEHLIADSGPIEFSTVQSDDMKALKGPVQFQQGPQAICDGVQPAPVADDSFCLDQVQSGRGRELVEISSESDTEKIVSASVAEPDEPAPPGKASLTIPKLFFGISFIWWLPIVNSIIPPSVSVMLLYMYQLYKLLFFLFSNFTATVVLRFKNALRILGVKHICDNAIHGAFSSLPLKRDRIQYSCFPLFSMNLENPA